MPRVPTYRQQQVAPDVQPTLRVPTASADKFGAPLQSGLSDLASAVQSQMDRADKAAADLAVANLRNYRIGLKSDPKTGYRNQLGQNFLATSADYADQYEKTSREMFNALTPRQRALAQPYFGDQDIAFSTDLQDHIAGQTRVVEEQGYQANIGSLENEATDMALSNPMGAGRLGEQVRASVGARAASLGMPVEWTEREATRILTNMHEGVLDTLLAAERTEEAKAYIAAYGGDMAGDRRAIQTERVNTAHEVVLAGRISSEVLGVMGPIDAGPSATKTLDAQVVERVQETRKRAEEAGLSKEAVGKAVRQADYEASRDAQEARVLQDQVLNEALQQIGAGATLTSIEASYGSRLTGEQKAALDSQFKTLTKGVTQAEEDALFYELQQQAYEDPQEFSRTNPSMWLPRFAPNSPLAKTLLGLRDDIIENQTDRVSDGRTQKEAIEDQLVRVLGLDPKKNAEDYERAFREFSQALNAAKGENPVLSVDLRNKMLDNLSASQLSLNVNGREYVTRDFGEPLWEHYADEFDVQDIPSQFIEGDLASAQVDWRSRLIREGSAATLGLPLYEEPKAAAPPPMTAAEILAAVDAAPLPAGAVALEREVSSDPEGWQRAAREALSVSTEASIFGLARGARGAAAQPPPTPSGPVDLAKLSLDDIAKVRERYYANRQANEENLRAQQLAAEPTIASGIEDPAVLKSIKDYMRPEGRDAFKMLFGSAPSTLSDFQRERAIAILRQARAGTLKRPEPPKGRG